MVRSRGLSLTRLPYELFCWLQGFAWRGCSANLACWLRSCPPVICVGHDDSTIRFSIGPPSSGKFHRRKVVSFAAWITRSLCTNIRRFSFANVGRVGGTRDGVGRCVTLINVIHAGFAQVRYLFCAVPRCARLLRWDVARVRKQNGLILGSALILLPQSVSGPGRCAKYRD